MTQVAAAVSSLDEEELVRRFREREESAYFEQLYRKSRRSIFALCLHFMRDHQVAEDLCHDVFVAAYERFSTLEGERFLPWVRSIARNLCLNRLRRRRLRDQVEPTHAPVGHVADTEEAAIARQQLEIAAAVLAGLPSEQRRVFLLFHTRGMSYREISTHTGHSAEQVRSHLQNARRNFHGRYRRQVSEGADHGRA